MPLVGGAVLASRSHGRHRRKSGLDFRYPGDQTSRAEQARLASRIAQAERLGNLGWAEWDLLTGDITWSRQLYRIFERDPAAGPLGRAEGDALTLPEDEPLRRRMWAYVDRGRSAEETLRVRVGGCVKYLRLFIDAVRDGGGRPVKLFGIIQDVTDRHTREAALAATRRELRANRESLAAEHRAAAQLQQIILPLPVEPIDLPGLRVAVRYLPARHAGRVGGDWYHAAATPDGDVILAVGDVAGHGIRAATVMAQLRHALTTLVVTTTVDPALLLTHLNRLLTADPATMVTATAVIARYRPATRTLVWAQAGHPAPLHTRHGHTAVLPRPAGPLLGAFPRPAYDTATLALRDGHLLLLYTDGLIEDRTRSIDDGLASVIATLNRITAAGSQHPLADLLDQLPRANPADDTCVLAARPRATPAAPAQRTQPGVPGSVPR